MTRRKTWKDNQVAQPSQCNLVCRLRSSHLWVKLLSRTNHQPFQSALRSGFASPLLLLLPIRKEKRKIETPSAQKKKREQNLSLPGKSLAPFSRATQQKREKPTDREAVSEIPFCHPLPIFSMPFHAMLQTPNKVKSLSTSWRFCVSHSSRLADDNGASSANCKSSTTVVREQTWKSIPDSEQM